MKFNRPFNTAEYYIHDYVIHTSVVMGKNVKIGFNTVIEEDVKIGNNTFIGHNVVIRSGCRIGKDTVIGHGVVMERGIIIGDRVLIHVGCQLTTGITIEDDVFIAPHLSTTNDKKMVHSRRHIHPFVCENCLIKRAARIAAGVILLPGITIGENSIVGAGSLVTKDIPDEEVWFGVPARFVRKVPEEEII